MAKTASKTRKNTAAKEEAAQPILQAHIPIYGERVRRTGSDTEFEITFVSVDYRQVHIGIPRTNFDYRNVEAATLTYLEQRQTRPAKPYVDVDPVWSTSPASSAQPSAISGPS